MVLYYYFFKIISFLEQKIEFDFLKILVYPNTILINGNIFSKIYH